MERRTPRLYLVTPQVADAAHFRDHLAAALEGADIAAVLLRLGQDDERGRINCAKVLAPIVQRKDAALLLDGNADLVARAGADGAHLTGIDNVTPALASLKPERIVGAGGMLTRHDAMLAAEAGADYIMFGEPDAIGHRPAFATVEERVAWWAEICEVPCVGFAANADEVLALGRAGADFIAVCDFVWADVRGPNRAVAEAAQRLRLPEAVQ
ncbi:MAG: thiamine phosphate synthase [Xanthobacteraceae bacterium]